VANKVHTINIGGKERTLKYTFGSARKLYGALEKIKGERGLSWFEYVRIDNLEAWLSLVCHGLTHETKTLNPDMVSDWFDELLEAGVELRKSVVWPAIRALGESGACGTYWTLKDDGSFVADLLGKDDAAVA
jgi:hypothetical protein